MPMTMIEFAPLATEYNCPQPIATARYQARATDCPSSSRKDVAYEIVFLRGRREYGIVNTLIVFLQDKHNNE